MTASFPTIPPGLSGRCFFEFDLVCWTVTANYSPDTTACLPSPFFLPQFIHQWSGLIPASSRFWKRAIWLVNSIGKKRKTSPIRAGKRTKNFLIDSCVRR